MVQHYNLLAFIVATVAACIPLLVVGRTVYVALISPRRYQPAPGRVLKNRQRQNDEGEPIQIELLYEYSVAQSTFTGRRFYFGSLNECDPELLERFPEGSQVTVHYDPRRPMRSTLQTGYHWRLNFWIAVAGAAALGLWLVVWLLMYLPPAR